MQQCSNSEAVAYVTFWAVASFSFFIASDKIEASHEAPVLTPALASLRVVVHTAALNCLGLAAIDAYRLRRDGDWVCKRPSFVEAQCLLSGAALLLVNAFVSLQDAFKPEDVHLELTVRLLPWLATTAFGAAHAAMMLRG